MQQHAANLMPTFLVIVFIRVVNKLHSILHGKRLNTIGIRGRPFRHSRPHHSARTQTLAASSRP